MSTSTHRRLISLSLLPIPHRISPRLLRPLLLLALLCAVAYVGHISLNRAHALENRDSEEQEQGERYIGIQPVGPWPEPVDIIPEWLDQPLPEPSLSPEEPPAPSPEPVLVPEQPPPPPVVYPWLPNPTQAPLNFPQAVLSPPGPKPYMHNTSIPALTALPGPAAYPCVDDDVFGPLLLVGVFSTAGEWEQRAVLRALQARGMNTRSPRVEFKFILGRENATQVKATRAVRLEQEAYGDVVLLDTDENMDDGKTFAFFRWAAQLREGDRPRFVMKADSDTFLVLPNVLASFSTLTCAQNVYWGTFWGSCGACYPLYMRGLAYALSWPLVAWLGKAQLGWNDTAGIEDIRTAGWFTSLPREEVVQVVDWKRHMGDWYGGTIPHDVHTVALHAMKSPAHWLEVAQEITGIWKREGWEYTWPPAEG
ncbi:glycosyltransferase family 31 protein [Calocera viscosa TUFC12733]|uniref:Hexosyltransferase n=1 Tax=Calocera viscosa (strain TUFC12733) TaxID=1330018 RepID=A0A167PGJ3_CALVF|nr:glycosyltransferase family 31 protein [Calocera viscosa TUFC12733]